MIVDKEYKIKIRTGKQKVNYLNEGIFCNIDDDIMVKPKVLISLGSTVLLDCVCDSCGTEFKRQARQIKERTAGDKLCKICSISATATGREKSEDTRNKLSLAHRGKPKSEEQKNKVAETKKKRIEEFGPYKVNKTSMPGDLNPSWKEKSGLALFLYECEFEKTQTIRRLGLKANEEEYIVYKINPKSAYKIGIDSKFVGSNLEVVDRQEYLSWLSSGNDYHKFSTYVHRPPKEAKKFSSYRNRVTVITNKTYEENKDFINPSGLPRGKQKIGSNNYQVDHIVPVIVCWEHNIHPSVAGSALNIQMLHWRDNISKNDNMSAESELLLNKLIEINKEISYVNT